MARLLGNSIEKFLRSYAKSIIKKAQAIVQPFDDTGKLRKSLKYRLHAQDDGSYKLFFSSTDYGDYKNKGVQGSKGRRYYITAQGKKKLSPYKYSNNLPNVSALEGWIKRKGIQGRDKNTGRFITRKSLAFIFSKSIQRKGLKALNFYTKPISEGYKQLIDGLATSLKMDILTTLKDKRAGEKL